jgi:hypothetical protein
MDLSKLSDDELNIGAKLADWTKNKFSQEQFDNAKKVFKKAKEYGLNPDFVLPMVMQESGFNTKAKSNKDAIGVMQIIPTTGDLYKCDIHNTGDNIDCGMKIIKDLVSNPKIGNDPYRVLAGYNAGPDTPYLKTNNLEDVLPAVIDHYEAVSKYYGGDLPSVLAELPTDTSAEKKAVPNGSVPNTAVPDVNRKNDSDVPYLGSGAYVGAGTAATLEAAKKGWPLLNNVLNKAVGTDAHMEALMNRRQSKFSMQRYLNSQINPNLNIRLTLSDLEKETNTTIRTYSELQDALAKLKAIPDVPEIPETSERVAIHKPGATKPIYQQKITPGTPGIPGRPAIDLSKYEYKPNMFSGLTKELGAGKYLATGALPVLGNVLSGGVLGALSFAKAKNAFDQYKEESLKGKPFSPDNLTAPSRDVFGQLTSAGGMAVGALPFKAAKGIGLVSQLPEILNTGWDYYKRALPKAIEEGKQWAKDNPPSPEELTEANRGYGGYNVSGAYGGVQKPKYPFNYAQPKLLENINAIKNFFGSNEVDPSVFSNVDPMGNPKN